MKNKRATDNQEIVNITDFFICIVIHHEIFIV